jgi:hypothetical protein
MHQVKHIEAGYLPLSPDAEAVGLTLRRLKAAKKHRTV